MNQFSHTIFALNTQSKNRSYSERAESPGVKEQLFPWCQPLILQMKLLKLTELLQALHHCDPVSTKIPTQQKNHTRSYTPKAPNNYHSVGQKSVKCVYLQFGELLKIREIVYL